MKTPVSILAALVLGFGIVHTARAQTAPASETTAIASAPQLRITGYDKTEFLQPSKLSLQTWQMQSKGVGELEVYAWYIAGGKARLFDQRLLSWIQKPQEGEWRLLLLGQIPAGKTQFPTLGLQTVFAEGDGPNVTVAGIASSARQKPPPLPSAFYTHYTTMETREPGFAPHQPFILYAAEAGKTGKIGTNAAYSLMIKGEKNPVAALTQRSRTNGGAFLIVTLSWKPAKPTAAAAQEKGKAGERVENLTAAL